VADGTPRDCSSNGCGSQADTAIIRDGEIESGEVGPLGRTQGNGPVDPAVMIQSFMGTGVAPTNNGAEDSTGVEDDLSALNGGRGNRNNNDRKKRQLGGLLGGLFGGGGGDSSDDAAAETIVAQSEGVGATDGLPTCSDSGEITVTMRQVSEIKPKSKRLWPHDAMEPSR
jgi:hypothetical protein